MAVPPQLSEQDGRRLVERGVLRGEQTPQVHRFLTTQRFGDAQRGDLADAGQLLQRAGGDPRCEVGLGEFVDGPGRAPERLHAVGGFAGPLEQERDLSQVDGGVTWISHASTVTKPTVTTQTVTRQNVTRQTCEAALVDSDAAEPRPGVSAETVRRIEQATGRLATQSVARMDDELPWFRELPPAQRSWVTLVAQAGLQSYVEWLRSPDDVLRLTGEVFATAPQAMARSVNLQQTVELVRQAIEVAEQNLPLIAGADVDVVREELLRFSRELAFAAARVYATAAENRGTWDRRLEALVIDSLVSGSVIGDPLPSQLAALGWHDIAPMAVIAGSAPDGSPDLARAAMNAKLRRLGLDAMVGLHAGRLVVVVGGCADPLALAGRLLTDFGDGPVVAGPTAAEVSDAVEVAQATLSGLRAAAAWPGAPRPVSADALLPERALAGDIAARVHLVEAVYRPLASADDVLLDTVAAFLDAGNALEATARALFVHANTVRYRLRRVADVCGETPTDARGAFTLRLALALGRLDDATG